MSSVSIESSRSGHPILLKDGRLLGSSFDPVKEAATWVERESSRLEGDETAVVLGLGAGYHIAALRALKPRLPILVVESDAAVAKAAASIAFVASAIASEFREGRVIVEPEPHRLIEHGAFRDALGGRIAILKHGPSCILDPAYHSAVEVLLTGREPWAFLLQLKTRPDLHALLDADAIRALGTCSAPGLVSVKTLQKLFSARATCTRERRLWKLLEELVA